MIDTSNYTPGLVSQHTDRRTADSLQTQVDRIARIWRRYDTTAGRMAYITALIVYVILPAADKITTMATIAVAWATTYHVSAYVRDVASGRKKIKKNFEKSVDKQIVA